MVPRANSFIQKVLLMVLIFRIPTTIIVTLLKRKRLNNIQWLSSNIKRIIDRRNKYVFNCYKDMSIGYVHEKKKDSVIPFYKWYWFLICSQWCYFFFFLRSQPWSSLILRILQWGWFALKSNNLYFCAGFLVLFFISINFLSFIYYGMFWILGKLNLF